MSEINRTYYINTFREEITLNSVLTTVSYYIRTTLKLVVLCFIAAYFLYISVLFQKSDNYSSTREACLSQPGQCDSPMEVYKSIVLADDDNYQYNYFPVCYFGSNPCIDHNILVSCQAELSSSGISYDTEGLNEQISNIDITYIPYSIWVIIFTCSAIILTFLFDNIHLSRVRQGQFNSSNDRINMKRLNNTIIICNIGFLIASLYSYILITDVSCNEEYDGKTNLCQALSLCGGTLSVLITPNNILLNHFGNIIVACIILSVISLVIHKSEPFLDIYSINHNDNTPMNIRPIAIRQREIEMVPVDFSNITTEEAERLFTQRYPNTNTSNENVPVAERIISHWKYHSSAEQIKSCDSMECSICLSELFQSKKVSSVDDLTTSASHRSRTYRRIQAYEDNSNNNTNNQGNAINDIESNNNIPNQNVNIENDNIVVEIPCGHCFHKSCILLWCLQQRNTVSCPICRQQLS